MTFEHPGFDPDAVAFPAGSFVGDAFIAGDASPFVVRRPSDGRVVAEQRGAGSAAVERAVALAKETQRRSGWASRGPRARAKVLRAWADLIEKEPKP